MSKEETPQSPKDVWRKTILQYDLPDHVLYNLERLSFSDLDKLTEVERAMLPRDAERFSPDERELAYIQSSLLLPQRWTDEEGRVKQERISAALKNRGKELVAKIGEERAREILGSRDPSGIQE